MRVLKHSLTKLSIAARQPIIPMHIRLKAIAITFTIAAAGQLYIHGAAAGYDSAQDECYGMSCTDYTLIIGQASKEAKQQQKKKKSSNKSVWEALDK